MVCEKWIWYLPGRVFPTSVHQQDGSLTSYPYNSVCDCQKALLNGQHDCIYLDVKSIFTNFLLHFNLRNNHVDFPGALFLGHQVSKGCKTFFWSFQGWRFVLSSVFTGRVRNLKLPGVILKKYVLNPPPLLLPCLFFFWNSSLAIRNNKVVSNNLTS